jgi:hypothetical protein
MPLLFSYGTLREEPVQRATFGRRLEGRPDEILGFAPTTRRVEDEAFVRASGQAEHAILRFDGRDTSRVQGMVFEVTDDELARADAYEPTGWVRVPARLASGPLAWVYAEATAEAQAALYARAVTP